MFRGEQDILIYRPMQPAEPHLQKGKIESKVGGVFGF